MPMLLPVFITLTACDHPNVQQTAQNLGVESITDIGKNMLINAVQAECENQLQNNAEFANIILTAEQRANLCGCTANELKENLSQEKLASIISNGTIDTQAMSDVITGAMATCTARQPNSTASNANTSSSSSDNNLSTSHSENKDTLFEEEIERQNIAEANQGSYPDSQGTPPQEDEGNDH
ncbi:MAG: hypothetical protein Q4D05_08400 [Acinetobacter sp.]|nr:hypothetical protein [Acinetobacter sp.]